MRRFIVICLIFLFPLQVFADSADYPPMHIVAPDNLSEPETNFASEQVGGITSLIAKVCEEDGFDQPPAHSDLTDVLIQALPFKLAEPCAATKPSGIRMQHYVLFLPLIKPPPRL